MLATLHRSASVFYRACVIDSATGREVAALPRKKNLILNQGLDMVASQRWSTCINFAAAGSDATPTRRDSGAVTVSRAAATLTASAGFFVPEDVGRLFKFNTGEEVVVSAYTSATSVNTTTSGTIAASAGTMWAVNQTGLLAELARTGTYGTAGGDNSTTLDTLAGTLTQRRTFIFPPESALRTYREVGWSPQNDAGANLFGRDVLPGAGLTLVAGQQLKIVLDLVITVEPLAPESADALAWSGGTAEQQLENLWYGSTFDPSDAGSRTVFLGEGTDAFILPRVTGGDPGGPLSGTRYTVGGIADAYVAGSHERNVTAVFTLNDGNSAAIRCAGYGWTWFSSLYPVLRVRFSANQVKDSDHTLTLTFRDTWGRVLVN
jgi:hypothetical protein